MRETFRKDMRLLYPEGLNNARQHRDVVRIYCMAWCGALISRGDKEAVEAWVREFAPTADPNWWPSDSWKWW